MPNSLTVIAIGTKRSDGGRLAGQVAVLYGGPSGPRGEASFQAPISPALVGRSIFSQCFTAARVGATQRILSSNVIETRFVP